MNRSASKSFLDATKPERREEVALQDMELITRMIRENTPAYMSLVRDEEGRIALVDVHSKKKSPAPNPQ